MKFAAVRVMELCPTRAGQQGLKDRNYFSVNFKTLNVEPR
jgi:hypothetical protein